MKNYLSGPTGHTVTDPDFPGVVGTGRTIPAAEKDFDNAVANTWHEQRIARVQGVLDQVLAWNGIDREEYMQLQAMMDDFIGLLREKGDLPPAIEVRDFANHVPEMDERR